MFAFEINIIFEKCFVEKNILFELIFIKLKFI